LCCVWCTWCRCALLRCTGGAMEMWLGPFHGEQCSAPHPLRASLCSTLHAVAGCQGSRVGGEPIAQGDVCHRGTHAAQGEASQPCKGHHAPLASLIHAHGRIIAFFLSSMSCCDAATAVPAIAHVVWHCTAAACGTPRLTEAHAVLGSHPLAGLLLLPCACCCRLPLTPGGLHATVLIAAAASQRDRLCWRHFPWLKGRGSHGAV